MHGGVAGPIAAIDSPSSPLASESVAGPSTGTTPNTLPPLTSHDKAKFRKIFQGSGAQNGFLGGEFNLDAVIEHDSNGFAGQQAREVFMKSKLPWNTLSQIWCVLRCRH